MINRIFRVWLMLVSAIVPVSASADEWDSYGGSSGGGRYAPLNQITPDNINRLDVAWTYRSGDVSDGSGDISQTSFQATPIYFDHRVILCTPFGRVVAIDPATGREIWSFDPKVDIRKRAATRQTDGAPLRCRGVTGWTATVKTGTCDKMVFLGSIDGRIFAIDATTGRPCPAFNGGRAIDLNALPPSGKGEVNISSPPVAIGNIVVFGLSIGDNSHVDMQHGVVRAFDARTGEPAWQFDPIPAELRGKTGAANVWAPPSASPERGKVFLPTTSPSPDYFGGERTGDLPYADAVVALSAATGTPDWAFKTVRHNLWDYDLASQPVLIPSGAGTVTGPVVAQATKQGLIFLLDAASGKPVFPMREIGVPASNVEGERSSPTQIVPELPAPIARTEIDPSDAFGLTVFDAWLCRRAMTRLDYKGLFTPPSLRGTLNVPAFSGGVNWGGIAVDPDRHILVVNSLNFAGEVRLIPEADFNQVAGASPGYEQTMMRGTPFGMQRRIIRSPFGVPCNQPPWGEITAIDLKTGKQLWRRPHGQVRIGPFFTPEKWGSPGMGGAMITASGIVFLGASMDRTMRAYDIESGEIIWRYRDLAASAMASPMTFAHDGKQYVVVAAGGHAAFGEFGDTLVAFALKSP